MLTTVVTVCTTCCNVDSLRFVRTLYLCVQLYCATNMAGHSRAIYHSGSFASLRPALYGDGHTVECAVVTLFIVVYNYSTLFTVLGLASAVMLLCRTYDACVCVDFINFSRHANIRNLHPVAMLYNWRSKNSFCTQYVGTATSAYSNRRTCLYHRQTAFITGPRKCSGFNLTPRLLELHLFLADCNI